MKNSFLLVVSLSIASLGFSQTSESTTKAESKVSCAKGKLACCAHAKKKKSCENKASAQTTPSAHPQTIDVPSIQTTEPNEADPDRDASKPGAKS